MAIDEKELGKTLQALAGQLNSIENSVVRIAAGLAAVKGALCVQLNPSDPKQALEHIQKLEDEVLRLDPHAESRKKLSDVLEVLKMIDKHGGPKQA